MTRNPNLQLIQSCIECTKWVNGCSRWVLCCLTAAHTVRAIYLTITSTCSEVLVPFQPPFSFLVGQLRWFHKKPFWRKGNGEKGSEVSQITQEHGLRISGQVLQSILKKISNLNPSLKSLVQTVVIMWAGGSQHSEKSFGMFFKNPLQLSLRTT